MTGRGQRTSLRRSNKWRNRPPRVARLLKRGTPPGLGGTPPDGPGRSLPGVIARISGKACGCGLGARCRTSQRALGPRKRQPDRHLESTPPIDKNMKSLDKLVPARNPLTNLVLTQRQLHGVFVDFSPPHSYNGSGCKRGSPYGRKTRIDRPAPPASIAPKGR